jgi:hypothetical protein
VQVQSIWLSAKHALRIHEPSCGQCSGILNLGKGHRVWARHAVSLGQALEMTPEERRRRMLRLRSHSPGRHPRLVRPTITHLDVKDAFLTTVSAASVGDTVVEIGRAELTLAGGDIVAIKYVVHWKHHEGAWKWHTDIWNMNQ